jgi:hypothetical protein
MHERVLRADLTIGDVSLGAVVARLVDNDDGTSSGWLSVTHGQPPGDYLDGSLRPREGGPDLAIHILASAGGRIYFTGRSIHPVG